MTKDLAMRNQDISRLQRLCIGCDYHPARWAGLLHFAPLALTASDLSTS